MGSWLRNAAGLQVPLPVSALLRRVSRARPCGAGAPPAVLCGAGAPPAFCRASRHTRQCFLQIRERLGLPCGHRCGLVPPAAPRGGTPRSLSSQQGGAGLPRCAGLSGARATNAAASVCDCEVGVLLLPGAARLEKPFSAGFQPPFWPQN